MISYVILQTSTFFAQIAYFSYSVDRFSLFIRKKILISFELIIYSLNGCNSQWQNRNSIGMHPALSSLPMYGNIGVGLS